jgi:hexokinase
MEFYGKTAAFLSAHGFAQPSVASLTDTLLYDMELGLAAEPDGTPGSAAEPMIAAPGRIPRALPSDKKVIVVDAGGTNFRSCLVNFTGNGSFEISDQKKTEMPGIRNELSKNEFYDSIAGNLEYLKDMSPYIGFCFSYAMRITANGDGQILAFSKEIKAPEAVGTYVGQSLSEALVRRGWKKPEKITLLNDTMAALLAGSVNGTAGKKFSSYAGFVLGTGINNAYIEYAPVKKTGEKSSAEHIVICECGMYNKLYQSEFDKEADSRSVKPGTSTLEKMCSGVYLGKVAFSMLSQACSDRLFSENFCSGFHIVSSVSPADIDGFLYAPFDSETLFGKILADGGTEEDRNILYILLDTLIERTSRIVSAVLSATVLKSGKGLTPAEPVCIVCNGTTFWRTHDLYEKIQCHMKKNLSATYRRYYEIVKIENDITLGTAAAALM